MNDLATTIQTKNKLTDEQLALIKLTIAKDASDDELKMFLYRCEILGLDPLKNQIYFVKYVPKGEDPKKFKGSIVVGIDGMRARADRTKKHVGTDRGLLYGPDNKEVIGAFSEVFRSDWDRPARIEVYREEYDTGKGLWQTKPKTLLMKTAEHQALRLAFPDELSGLESMEEVEARDVSTAPPAPRELQPREIEEGAAQLGIEPAQSIEDVLNMVIKAGKKLAGKRYRDVSFEDLQLALNYLRSKDADTLTADENEFVFFSQVVSDHYKVRL